ncbi:hypothetical protein BON30_20565 [Cystobacter ferrugineus]|uniref:Uncharacterized protein n=1 Tax=Cystobacter ferrugineus TaxID=83449 RepID=A0A1L9B8V5_9BACT|nr:hypothetical protein BON30_20565 [Cystobacter ferrugineus]
MQCYKYLENSPSCGPSGRYYQKDCWHTCTLTRPVTKGPYTQVIYPISEEKRICSGVILVCDDDPPIETPDEPFGPQRKCHYVPNCRNEVVHDYDGPCNGVALDYRNTHYPDQVNTITTRYTYSLMEDEGGPAMCNFWLQNVREQFSSGPNNPACGFSYQHLCDDESRPIYNNCRHPEHGNADVNECANGYNSGPDGWSSTAHQNTPEQASERVKTHWTSLGNATETPVYITAPRCVTCEDEATPSTRYECLMRGLDPAQRNWREINTRYKLLMHLRLLYEFNAHELSADPVEAANRRAKILALLEQDGPTYPTCGKEVAYLDESHPDPRNPDCATLYQQYFKLNFCARLTSDYVPVAASNASFDYCAGLIPVFSQDHGTCRDTLASWGKDYQDTLYALASRMVKESSSTALTDAQVQRRLDAIQQWYDYAFRAGQTPDPALWQQLDGLMGAFWKVLYDAEAPFDSNGPAEGGYRDVSQFVAEGLAVDQKVLRAAIANMARTDGGPQPKLKRSPLLLTLGGGLRTLANRVEDTVMLHDLGCRFHGCKVPESRTQVSELMGLIGSLHDPAALDVRLRRLATTHAVANEWRTVFQDLYNNHAVIQAALEEWMVPASTGSAETFASRFMKTDDSRWPSLLLEFVQQVKDAEQRTSSYEATGRFEPGLNNILHTGMQDAQFGAARKALIDFRTDLETELQRYEAEEEKYVERLVAQIGNEAAQAQFKSQMVDRVTRMAQLYEDLAGLKLSSAHDEAKFGDFMKSFVDAAEAQRANRPPYELLLQNVEFSLTARSSARFNPEGANTPEGNTKVGREDVRALSVPGSSPIHLETGDILYINTQGSWSPTCALRKVRADSYGSFAGFSFDTVTTTPTGPEGYLISRVASGTTAISNQSVNSAEAYANVSVSNRACAGARADMTVKSPDPLGIAPASVSLSAYGMLETCKQVETGMRAGTNMSTSASFSGQTGMSASFAMGIRAQDTPYPTLPTGSLLAALVEQGKTAQENLENVYLVQAPSTAIIAKNPVDVYLVANELATCMDADTSYTMRVNVRVLRPESESTLNTVAKAAMLELETLRENALKKQGQGRLLPEDLTQLRQAFWVNMGKRSAPVPAELHPLVEQWVTRELAETTRAVERQSIERQLELMALEVRAINDGLKDTQRKQTLLEWLPRRSLQNMDAESLRLYVRSVSRVLNDYLYPILELRYPVVLQTLRSSTGSQGAMTALNSFINADFNGSYASLAHKLIAVAKQVEAETELLSLAHKGNPTVSVAYLSIPRPREQWSPQPQPPPAAQPPETVYYTLDAAMSESIWDKVNRTSIASIAVRPEDIFQADGTKRLSCEKDVPIIRNMMVFFTLQRASDLERARTQVMDLPLSVDGDMVFPTKAGPQHYRMQNATWLSQSFGQPLFGHFNQAASTYSNWRNSQVNLGAAVANGLSPFTRFDINLRALKSGDLLHLVTEMVVVFEVETRSGERPQFPWIESCLSQPSDSSTSSSFTVTQAPSL